MKYELSKIRLSIGPLSQKALIGVLNKRGDLFLNKVEIENDFIHAVIQRWNGCKQTFEQDGKKWEVSVREIKTKP